MCIYIYTVLWKNTYTYEKKSLQVKGVSQKLKNSAFEEEIQSIHIKVLPKMHKYVKNYSQRKLVWSRCKMGQCKVFQNISPSLFNNVVVSLKGLEIVKSILKMHKSWSNWDIKLWCAETLLLNINLSYNFLSSCGVP